MVQQQTQHRPHLEFRHRAQISLPAVDDVEQRRLEVLRPSLLAPRQWERRDPRPPQRLIRLRQRLLPRPVMVAIIVRLPREIRISPSTMRSWRSPSERSAKLTSPLVSLTRDTHTCMSRNRSEMSTASRAANISRSSA
jgi:hypothetical protein